MKPTAMQGEFWLPDRPTERVPGKATFSSERGVRLELWGVLDGSGGGLPELDLIHGRVDQGKPVSLLRAFATSATYSGLPTQSFYAHSMILGAHTATHDQQRFREAFVQVALLPEWSRTAPLEHELTFDRGVPTRIQTAYSFPAEVVSKSGDVRYSITHGLGTGGRLPRSWEISTTTALRLRPRKSKLLGDLMADHIAPAQELIALATDFPCNLTEVSAKLRVSKGGRSWRYETVKVFYQPLLLLSDPPPRREPMLNEFLFDLTDLGEDFGGSLARWEASRRELDPVHGLYFTARFGRSMLLGQRFESYVKAAEAYHRRRVGGTREPIDVHQRRIESIEESVAPEQRKWLMQKLQFSNEPSLRRRLRGLLKHVPAVAADIAPKAGKFVHKVVNTRNYQAHHTVELKREAVSGRELLVLSRSMRYLMTALLLMEVGIPESQIRDRLARSRAYLNHLAMVGSE